MFQTETTDPPAILTSKNSSAAALGRSIELAEKKLEPFRKQRKRFLEHYAGAYYGDSSFSLKIDDTTEVRVRQPLNLVFSMVSAMEPAIGMRAVQARVRTETPDCSRFALQQQHMIDAVMRRIRASDAIRRAVRDAFFGPGILKTAWDEETGRPRVEEVSLDRYFIDHRCRKRCGYGKDASYAYEGHTFRMSLDQAAALVKPEHRDRLKKYVVSSAPNKTDKASDISGQEREDEYDPQVELREVYVPRDQMLFWLPVESESSTDYLAEIEWYGHEEGPYDWCVFAEMNDNVMPVALVGVTLDLVLLENTLAVNLARRAERFREIGLIDAANQKEADRVAKAEDQAIIYSPGLKGTVMSFGGTKESEYAAISYLHDFCVRLSKNPELIGGTRAQSGTATQDTLLARQANLGVDDMREAAYDMAGGCAKKIAWYNWHDDSLRARFTTRIPGVPVPVPTRWQPGIRAGEFEDYEYGVSADRLADQSPEARYMRLKDWWTSFVMPMAAFAAQQGSHPNVDTIPNQAAELADLDDVDNLWVEGPIIQGGVQPTVPGQVQQAGAGVPPTRPTMAQRPIEAMAQPTGAMQ